VKRLVIHLGEAAWRVRCKGVSLGVEFFDLAWQAVELGSTGRTFLKCLFQRLKPRFKG